jgi:hypothetical protein
VAALAAAQGIDVSDAAAVRLSPMAAEATVAALSALMKQPARQPLQPPPRGQHQPHQPHGARRGAGAAAAAGGKQLLSFADEVEEGALMQLHMAACLGF